MRNIFLKEALKIAAKNLLLSLACIMTIVNFSTAIAFFLGAFDSPSQAPLAECICPDVSAEAQAELDDLAE